MRYDPENVDWDLLHEAKMERRQRVRLFGPCQCGDDMPGSCPGPANCPMCQEDEPEDAS
jgi:hypothetical protein